MRASLYRSVLLKTLRRPPRLAPLLNLARYRLARHTGARTVRHTPVSLVVYLTKRCNFSCEFCYAQDTLNLPDHRKNELTREQFQRILDSPFGRNALRIGLLGGEPFLNRNILEYFRMLNERRVISTVVTNCALIRDEHREAFRKDAPTVFGLSLYDNNREAVARTAGILNSLRHPYWIQTVIRADRLEEMESAARFATEIGCKHLLFSNYYPTGRKGIERVVFDDHPGYPEAREAVERSHGSRLAIKWMTLIPAAVRDPLARPPTRKHCEMPKSYVHIDNLGDLGGCCMRTPDGSRFGNIFEESDPWNRPFYQDLRAQMADDSLPPEDHCRYCECWVDDLYGI